MELREAKDRELEREKARADKKYKIRR